MKHTYHIRVDYKDEFGNDIRLVKGYKNRLTANFAYWRFSLPKDVSVTYLKDGVARKKVIK